MLLQTARVTLCSFGALGVCVSLSMVTLRDAVFSHLGVRDLVHFKEELHLRRRHLGCHRALNTAQQLQRCGGDL